MLGSDQKLRNGFSSLIEQLPNDDSNEFNGFFTKIHQIKDRLDKITEPDASVLCSSSPEATNLADLTAPNSVLIRSPVTQVANISRLSRDIKSAFSSKARAIPETLINFQPRLKSVLYPALANANVVEEKLLTSVGSSKKATSNADTKEALPELISLHAMRLSASLFGNNAPVKMVFREPSPPISGISLVSVPSDEDWNPNENKNAETNARLYLDNAYDSAVEGAHVIVDDNHTDNNYKGRITAATVDKVTIHPRTAYSISGKITQIELSKEWCDVLDMASIRETMVYLETEKLVLSTAPDTSPVAGRGVDLQGLYGELPAGRWVIVSGELADVPGTSGVRMAELALVANVEHETLRGENKLHTRITFDKELGHRFKRDTVTIYGNVVKATHGETRKEVLGSGDGAKALQSFVLKQPPLTFVSAANSSGIDSSLRVFVNDIQWRESDTLAGLAPADRYRKHQGGIS